jgi:hypothetical protein
VLQELFNSLIQKGVLDVKQLANIGKLPKSSMYDLLKDGDNRMVVAMHGWLSVDSPGEVRIGVLRELTGGRAMFPLQERDHDLDLNKDGKIDMGDALAACIGACGKSQHMLETVHVNFMKDPDSITMEVLSTLHKNIETVTEYLTVTDRICTREVSRRRQAKMPKE